MKTMENIGKLGFGLMRLPHLADGSFDKELICRMFDSFLEAGFNYFDTAWAYDGSEEVTRETLIGRYPRESFYLTTKNACWRGAENKEQAENQLSVSLSRLGTDYLDFYLLHNIGEKRTEAFERFGMWDFVEKKKQEGVIRSWGFSFHDKPEVLKQVLSNHAKPDVVQLQINYADWINPDVRSRECYEICRERDIPVIVMEPVRGGMLSEPPASVEKILRKAEPEATPASWAVRFAAGLPGVVTVLSGMNTMEQLRDNIQSVRGFTAFSKEEQEVILKAQEELAKFPMIPCTACDYCASVCPQNVGISGTFNIMNVNTLYGAKNAKSRVGWVIRAKNLEMPDACIGCGACEEVCPQHLHIRDLLKEAASVLCTED